PGGVARARAGVVEEPALGRHLPPGRHPGHGALGRAARHPLAARDLGQVRARVLFVVGAGCLLLASRRDHRRLRRVRARRPADDAARAGGPTPPPPLPRGAAPRGRVLEDHPPPDDPWTPESDRLDRIAAVGLVEPEPVIAPRTAWLTSRLLREVVTQGHSAPIR